MLSTIWGWLTGSKPKATATPIRSGHTVTGRITSPSAFSTPIVRRAPLVISEAEARRRRKEDSRRSLQNDDTMMSAILLANMDSTPHTYDAPSPASDSSFSGFGGGESGGGGASGSWDSGGDSGGGDFSGGD